MTYLKWVSLGVAASNLVVGVMAFEQLHWVMAAVLFGCFIANLNAAIKFSIEEERK